MSSNNLTFKVIYHILVDQDNDVNRSKKSLEKKKQNGYNLFCLISVFHFKAFQPLSCLTKRL